MSALKQLILDYADGEGRLSPRIIAALRGGRVSEAIRRDEARFADRRQARTPCGHLPHRLFVDEEAVKKKILMGVASDARAYGVAKDVYGPGTTFRDSLPVNLSYYPTSEAALSDIGPKKEIALKLVSVPTSVNEKILTALLRYKHFVLRHENAVVQDVHRALIPARQTVLDKLSSISWPDEPLSPGQFAYRRRLEVLMRDLDALIASNTEDGIGVLARGLEGIVGVEQDVVTKVLEKAVPHRPLGFAFARLPIEQVENILAQPLGGLDFADRMRRAYGETVTAMRAELAQSLLLGESVPKATKRIMGTLDTITKPRAENIARTEIHRVANETARASYDANKDLLNGIVAVATLDARTCPICAPLDGKEYYYDAKKGQQSVADAPSYPIHSRCRCAYSVIVKSFEELGIDAEDVPPSTRASLDGQVPATKTYSKWFKEQPEGFQRKVLGPGRFNLYKEGRLTLDQFSRDNKILRLDQLKKMVARKK